MKRHIISSLIWGGLFIAVGVLLLLDAAGIIKFQLGDLWKFWPLILIVIGVQTIINGLSKDK